MPSRRPLLIAALVAVAGFLGVLVARRGPEPNAPPPLAAKATMAPVADDAAPQPTKSPQRRVVRTETYFEPLDESQITGQQAAAAAARYRKAARFPRTSRPLDDGLDPIATSRAPTVDSEGDGKTEPRLLVYPSIASFEAPSEVVIYAEVVELRMTEARDDGEDKPARERLRQVRSGANWVRGVLQTADGVVVTPLEFRDDGTKGDAEAGDDFFTATYTPDPDRPNDFRGQYQVVAQAEALEGADLMASASFIYSVQTAHLTGHYRDAVVDGNLQIDAEVEVEEAGRYRLEGTLVTTANAQMLGYAHADVDLAPGTAWIPLTYYGLIFHDMKAEGPYSLFSTTLSTLGGAVAQDGDVVPNAHTTKAYKTSEFGDQPFNDPEYVRKAEYYENLARTNRNQ